MSGNNGAGRSLPHSLEAEEYLLSCAFVDAVDVIPRAQAAGITPASFYDSKHGVVFDCIQTLVAAGKPTATGNVAEELKVTKQLESIGGYAFLTQVSGRVPTTAQASYFIEKVREQAQLREAIRTGTALVESAYDFSGGSVTGHLAPAFARLRSAVEREKPRDEEMTWESLMNFELVEDRDCLMGKRYACRTAGLIFAAPSGMGKSVLAYQFSIHAALARPFFGLRMAFPMCVTVVQGEDDLGDVAETVQSVIREYGIEGDQLDQVKQRVRILRWNDAAGERFLSRLSAELRAHPADLVIINPLFSFCGCNVSEQEPMSHFLRNGLNPILNESRAAAIIIHHTNKPKDDEKGGKGDEELRYLMSGSSELTNWARAVITLQQVKSAGGHVYKMTFAKRGKRAGIVDADGKPTTSVLIEHSPRGLCWLPSDHVSPKGKFPTKIDIERARRTYVPGLPWARNKAAIANDQGLSLRTVHDYQDEIENPLAAVA
jgi:hypothetical protein